MSLRYLAPRLSLCLAPLALAACSSNEAVEADSSGAEVADAAPEGMGTEEIVAAMKDGVRPLPGQYSSKVELVDLDMPGMPADQLGQMKSMMAGSMAKVTSYCLTKEQAEKGFEEMARNAQDNCKVESFDVDGGKFSGRMRCSGEGSEGTMTMTGTGTETGSDMQMAMDMNSASLPGGKMAMKMHVTTQRIGDCEG